MPATRAGDPRRPHRPPRAGRKAAAAGRLGGRQGGRRAGAGADRWASSDASASSRRSCELIEAGFLYEAELYPERVLAFRHPLTREVAYGTQLGRQRAATHAAAARATDRAQARRHDELAALIADHMEAGGETLEAARWSPAPPTGPATAARRTRCGSGAKVTELTDGLEENEETTALAVLSRMLQLDYAWRLGMDRERGRRRWWRRRTEIADRDRRPALAGAAEAADRRPDPGVADRRRRLARRGVAEATALADESGDPTCGSRSAPPAAYAHLCAGDFDRLRPALDEVLELAGGDAAPAPGS